MEAEEEEVEGVQLEAVIGKMITMVVSTITKAMPMEMVQALKKNPNVLFVGDHTEL